MAELRIKRNLQRYGKKRLIAYIPFLINWAIMIRNSIYRPYKQFTTFNVIACGILLLIFIEGIIFFARRKYPYEYIIDDQEITWFHGRQSTKILIEKIKYIKKYDTDIFISIDNTESYFIPTVSISKEDAQLMFDLLQKRIVQQSS